MSMVISITSIVFGICYFYLGSGNKPILFTNNDYLQINPKGLKYKFGFSKGILSNDEIKSISLTDELLTVKIRNRESVYIRLDNIRSEKKLQELKVYVKSYPNLWLIRRL